MVGYLILDLSAYGKDLHTYLRQIESFLIDFSTDFGIETTRREGLTGVWVENRKLASIGVGVRKWVSMHGFGINISRDLSGYEAIVPCGISDVVMTSISQESNIELSVEQAALRISPLVESALNDLRVA